MPFGFGKKKKKQQEELDQAFSDLMKDIDDIEQKDDPKKIHGKILESCEQIVSRAKIIKKEEAEYELLTKYLKDVQKIMATDEDDARLLRDIASNIAELEKTRYEYNKSERRLPEEQYALMEKNERILPETISSLMENEQRQASIKREMQMVEGQKNEFEIELDQLDEGDAKVRKASIAGIVLLGSVLVLLLIIRVVTGINMTWGLLIVGFICAVMITALYYRTGYTRRERRTAKKNMNRSISMLNVIRMKYANVTAQVDYEREKYNVNSAHELSYLWEQYKLDRKEKEQYEQDNKDYVYLNKRLVEVLDRMELNDSRIWLAQTDALINEGDMKEINHKLVTRRKKVRAQLDDNLHFVRSERDEVTRLMREHDYYEGALIELIANIDQEMGWNKNYHFA